MGFNTKVVAIATTSIGCYLRFLIDVWYNFDLAATTIELNDVSHRVSRPRTTFQMLLHRQRKPLGQCTRYSEIFDNDKFWLTKSAIRIFTSLCANLYKFHKIFAHLFQCIEIKIFRNCQNHSTRNSRISCSKKLFHLILITFNDFAVVMCCK